MLPHAASRTAAARTRDALLADAAIAVLAFAASMALLAAGTRAGDDGAGIGAGAVALSALASLPLVARRAMPLGVFVVTALASVALRAVAEPAGPPVGPTLALYWAAAAGDGSRAGTRRTLAVAAALLAAHLTAAGLARDAFPGVEIAFGVLVWGGAWLAGDRTRLRRERIAELEERARRAERDAERERRLAVAEERARIARDLHDSAGHAINVILVHAGLGRLRVGEDPETARDAFATIEQVAGETVGEIDHMVRALREDAEPPAGGEGIEPSPGLAALDALVERHRAAGLDVAERVRGDRRALAPAVDSGAYRILQEALLNAARHGAGSARVELAFGARDLELTVENPLGAGGAAAAGGGHGLIGMRERAALVGGRVTAGTADGRFRVHATLPLGGRGR